MVLSQRALVKSCWMPGEGWRGWGDRLSNPVPAGASPLSFPHIPTALFSGDGEQGSKMSSRADARQWEGTTVHLAQGWGPQKVDSEGGRDRLKAPSPGDPHNS